MGERILHSVNLLGVLEGRDTVAVVAKPGVKFSTDPFESMPERRRTREPGGGAPKGWIDANNLSAQGGKHTVLRLV